jgi:hypothetical protein
VARLSRAVAPHSVGLDALDPVGGGVGNGQAAVKRNVRPGINGDRDA